MRIPPPPSPLPRPTGALLCVLLLLAAALSACGAGGSAATATVTNGAQAGTAGACANATVGALQGVAKRLYGEVAEGRILTQAAHRVLASRTLAEAVRSGDARTAARVLGELRAGQIVRIGVWRAGRRLVEVGAPGAIAPSRYRLLGAGGEVVGEVRLSIESAGSYGQTVMGITGMQVVVSSAGGLLASTLGAGPAHTRTRVPATGETVYGGVRYRVASFTGRTWSERGATFAVLVPPWQLAQCETSARTLPAAQIAARTLGAVAMNIYRGELSSRKVRAVVRQVERTPAFGEAVERHDPALARAAIIALFESRLHVVRVRVQTPRGVLVDVGGPYVLAPVRGTIRGASGRPIGSFVLALQDDMGYELLAHAFTGAQVLMREGATQVMGTLSPGPARIPDRGPVKYGGVTYQAFSFLARAFPEGPLRISLLFG
jgi:hypothetical protein